MSTDTLPEVESTEQHVANDPGMGGTEQEGDVRADGEQTETTQTEEEGQVAEGSEPEAKEEAPPAPAEVSAEDRAKIEQADAIANLVMGDPERMKVLRDWAAKDRGEVGGSEPLSQLDNVISEHFQRPQDQQALAACLKPFRDEILALRRELAGIRPKVDRADAMSVTGIFSQSLARHGVPNAFSDKGFLKMLSELRTDPDFQRDERTRPAYAARFAANEWKARSMSRSGNAAQRQQVERAKGGQLHGAASVNGNGVSKVHEIDDAKQGWDDLVFSILQKNPAAKIVLKSDKK